MNNVEIKQQLDANQIERVKLEAQIKTIKQQIAVLDADDRRVQLLCQHIDDGGFVIGMCKNCGTSLG